MSNSFSNAIKEAFAIAPTSKVILHTLEIRQTGVQDSLFLVQSRRELVAFDEDGNERTFEPVGFQFTLPASSEEGFRSLNLAVDNIGKRASNFVEAAKASDVPVQVYYRPYLSDDLSFPEMDPPLVLWLKDLQITDQQVVGKATFMDIVNKKFLSELYTRAVFPALA